MVRKPIARRGLVLHTTLASRTEYHPSPSTCPTKFYPTSTPASSSSFAGLPPGRAALRASKGGLIGRFVRLIHTYSPRWTSPSLREGRRRGTSLRGGRMEA